MISAKIKMLEWHNFDSWTHWAEGACGTYHVEERNGYWQVELRVGGLVHGVTETGDTTPADLDAAKAAAQADYDVRILAAIDTPALAPGDDLVERLLAEIATLRESLERSEQYSASMDSLLRLDAETIVTLRDRLARMERALTNLPAVYAHQINTGVREVYDPLQRFFTLESVLSSLTDGGSNG